MPERACKNFHHDGHEGSRRGTKPSRLDLRATWCPSWFQLSAVFIFSPILLFPLLSCSSKPDANTLVMLIESSPTNLDPRVGIDAQSERIDNLIFDDLLSRGDDLNVAPGLAERWEIPDPLTYVFHLHRGVKFHDGRTLTSRDVKWTFRFPAAGEDSQHQSGRLQICRSYRGSGRHHRNFSYEGTRRHLAVEFVRRSDWHGSVRQRR